MTGKTKGQIESQISEAMIRFEKEYMGRGPRGSFTYHIINLIFTIAWGLIAMILLSMLFYRVKEEITSEKKLSYQDKQAVFSINKDT